MTLLQFAAQLIEGKSPARARCLKSTVEKLKLYKGDKDFNNIGKQFFESWCSQFKAYSQSSLSRDISNLRYCVNEAVEAGITVTTKHKTTKFKMPKDESEAIYLTEKELMDLYSLNLNHDKTRCIVRDWFLIFAFTAQRAGDILKLSAQDFEGDILNIRQQKSKAPVSVPIHPIIKYILSERGMPKKVSISYINTLLPSIGRLAEITEKVTINRTINGKSESKVYAKCELITSHSARRSGVTNLIKAGIPTERVKLISGHSPNSQSFNKYVRLSTQENAADLMSHEYFNRKPVPQSKLKIA